MNKVMGILVVIGLVLVVGYLGNDLYQDCYGPDRGVLVQYKIQAGDTPYGIAEKFSSERYDVSKVMYESSSFRGIKEPRVGETIKVVTTLKRYEQLRDAGETVSIKE